METDMRYFQIFKQLSKLWRYPRRGNRRTVSLCHNKVIVIVGFTYWGFPSMPLPVGNNRITYATKGLWFQSSQPFFSWNGTIDLLNRYSNSLSLISKCWAISTMKTDTWQLIRKKPKLLGWFFACQGKGPACRRLLEYCRKRVFLHQEAKRYGAGSSWGRF